VTFRDHFSADAAGYAAFRPTYPDELFAWLASVAPARRLAWDCATGTGQAAAGLAAHFARVVATDASEAQIRAARAQPRVEYRVATAEASALGAASADLISVAQALHWFDIDRFFAEARRVLVKQGVLAIWTYGPLVVEGAPVDALLQDYYHRVVGPWWPPERALVDSGYAGIELPFKTLAAPAFGMSMPWTLNELLGYARTWSATPRHNEATGRDPVATLGLRLAEHWGPAERRRRVSWPLTVRAGRLTD